MAVNSDRIVADGERVRAYSVTGLGLGECWFRRVDDARDYIDFKGCRLIEVYRKC